MKIIKSMLKSVILSTLTIYSLNLITNNVGLIIPLNYFSVIVTSILGLPGLVIYSFLTIKFMYVLDGQQRN